MEMTNSLVKRLLCVAVLGVGCDEPSTADDAPEGLAQLEGPEELGYDEYVPIDEDGPEPQEFAAEPAPQAGIDGATVVGV
jgi:hypothetical protein